LNVELHVGELRLTSFQPESGSPRVRSSSWNFFRFSRWPTLKERVMRCSNVQFYLWGVSRWNKMNQFLRDSSCWSKKGGRENSNSFARAHKLFIHISSVVSYLIVQCLATLRRQSWQSGEGSFGNETFTTHIRIVQLYRNSTSSA